MTGRLCKKPNINDCATFWCRGEKSFARSVGVGAKNLSPDQVGVGAKNLSPDQVGVGAKNLSPDQVYVRFFENRA